MRNKMFPYIRTNIRIKKMLSCCWVTDIIADDGTFINPLEAFMFSLCSGMNKLEDIKYIYSKTFKKNLDEVSRLIDSTFEKLEKYLSWANTPRNRKQFYKPETFLYSPKIDSLAKDGRFETPGELVLILTHECNFKCIYCFNNSDNRSSTYMDDDEWIRVVDEAHKLGVVKCTLSGGEPLMFKGFFKVLQKVIDYGMASYVCSNGSLITKPIANKLFKMGLDCIQISLDSATPEIHDKMADVSGTFLNVINAIKYLVAEGIDVYVKSVITPLNIEEADKLIDLCFRLGVKRLTLDRFDLSNSGRGNTKFFMSREQEIMLQNLVDRKNDELKGKMIISAVTIPRCWSDSEDIISCGAFSRSLNILPTGDVSACEKVIGVDEMTVGNVKDSNMECIWNSEKARKIFYPTRDKADEPCNDCSYYSKCHTGCYALTLFVDKNPYAADPRCWKAKYENNPYKSCNLLKG